LGQIQHVRDAMGCPCWIVEFDTVVQRCREIQPGEEWDTATRLKGGGGTDFRCFFDELERIRTRTSPMAVAILITDACGAMPTEPQPRTCWLVPAALPVNVPFGMLLRYDEQ
jgi:predicted metal-dependent peptidase